MISYKLTENKPRLPGPLAHLGAGRSLSCNSTEAPNLTLSNCNSALLAIKITLGQLQLLPPAPHVQFCLENTGEKRSPGCESHPFVGRCQHQVGSGGSGGARWYPNLRCLNVNTNALHAGIFFFSPPLRLRKLMRVQQTGVSRGQLAEIWAASRRCWGSLKSLGFPAASPSPHHSFTDTRSGHRWSRVQNRSFVCPDGRARAPGTATRLECLHPNKPQAPRSAPAPRLGCKQSDSHPRGKGGELPMLQ